MFLFVAQGLLLCALLWAFWPSIRVRVFRTDLDNIPGPESDSFMKGNFGQIFDMNGWEFNMWIGERFGRVTRVYGTLGSKHLYIFDPKALHHIFVKDQHIFEETSSFLAGNNLALGQGLLSTQGEQHKKQRKMLNPVFSVAYMRQMVPMFNDVAQKLDKALKLEIANGAQEIDILHWMGRAALEMIGQSGLGYSFDPLVEGAAPHPFSEAAKALVPATSAITVQREYLVPMAVRIGTPSFRRSVVDWLPWENGHKIRDIIDTMDRTTSQIYQEKKKALQEGDEALAKQVGQAKDLMSILMKANMVAADEDKLSEKEVVAQMTTFCFAATDTTSGALSRALHILATHPEAQDRLREEILEARAKYGEIPYDELMSLPYMDAICRETLRLHPPVPTVLRVTRQDTILPLTTPIKGLDGRQINSIMVPNDTTIFVSILNANRDPELWGPDALEWKPERWLSLLPQTLLDAHMPGIYSNLMTFIGGSRACIGFKFSQLEMKVVLSSLVSQFRFSPSEKNIVWQMTGITAPMVEGELGLPQLPLNLELVDP